MRIETHWQTDARKSTQTTNAHPYCFVLKSLTFLMHSSPEMERPLRLRWGVQMFFLIFYYLTSSKKKKRHCSSNAPHKGWVAVCALDSHCTLNTFLECLTWWHVEDKVPSECFVICKLEQVCERYWGLKTFTKLENKLQKTFFYYSDLVEVFVSRGSLGSERAIWEIVHSKWNV